MRLFRGRCITFGACTRGCPSDYLLLISACGILGSNVPGTVGIFSRILGPLNGHPLNVHVSDNSVACVSGGTHGVLSSTNCPSYGVYVSGSLSRCLVGSVVERNTRISSCNINRHLVATEDRSIFKNICGLTTIRGGNRIVPGVGVDRGATGVALPNVGVP